MRVAAHYVKSVTSLTDKSQEYYLEGRKEDKALSV